ncbi:DUF5994 family protein [Streptomyces sp. NPDC057456]|uniref:DUF5994 family protein n=1 Tax=Streptomyces sp. NPDC057456 TaxID=3346139 RepID=UPI00368A33F0
MSRAFRTPASTPVRSRREWGPGRHRGGPETGPHHVVDLAPAPASRRAGRSPGRASHTETGGTSYGLLDGAWWPRLRDLLRELPASSDVLGPFFRGGPHHPNRSQLEALDGHAVSGSRGRQNRRAPVRRRSARPPRTW